MQKATTSKEKYGEILNDTIRTDANFLTSNEITATGFFRWHNAEYDKPSDSRPVELRVEKEKNPDNVLFTEGYFSGYEYCDRKGDITHYDRVTHWRELP